MGITVRYTNQTRTVAQTAVAEIDRVVRATAFRLEGFAKSIVRVDTGFAKNSIFTVTSSGSNQASSRQSAFASNKNARLLETYSAQVPQFTALVAVGAEYGEALEKRAPYLQPASVLVQPSFERDLKKVFNR